MGRKGRVGGGLVPRPDQQGHWTQISHKQPFLGPLSAPQNHWQQVFPSAYPTYFNPEDASTLKCH
jgi:hypothetical protein